MSFKMNPSVLIENQESKHTVYKDEKVLASLVGQPHECKDR